MKKTHNGYLTYELPDHWEIEEVDGSITLYDPDGEGAITMSFFNVFPSAGSIEERLAVLASNFIRENKIKMDMPLMVHTRKDGNTHLWGTGKDQEGFFLKIWGVAKRPKMVFATYFSEQKTDEVAICDSIIDSFTLDV